FGWTMVAVPYMAWGAELSADYTERTRITAWREGIGLVGLVGAGALSSFTAQLGWSERESIGAIAVLAIALGVLVFPLLLTLVPEKACAGPGQITRRWSLAEIGRALSKNPPFARLLSAWFLNGLANGIPAALFFIYLEHALGADDQQRPLFVLIYFASAILAIPAWQLATLKLGKHRAWCWAMILACAAFVTVPFIGAGQFVAFAMVCVATGAALGADLALPPSMQADVVDYGALRTGEAHTGLLFATWGMSTKLALAAAVGLALPGIEALGFDPRTSGEGGKQALVVIYALVPTVIKILVIALLWRFPLTAAKHGVIQRALERKTAKSNADRKAVL
ncbi:MAG: MFS transporter, partial [Rhodospirillaceae bacterium]